MTEPTHQLVVQFPQSAFPEFDDLVEYEEMLIEVLAGADDVDGHDSGTGEVNFFILTDDPAAALARILGADGGSLLSHPLVRVAARALDAEAYRTLWPLGDKRAFHVM